MSESREIHQFDYVNHSYEQVRDTLTADALAVFRAATKGASARAESLASALRVNVAGLEVVADIDISVTETHEKPRETTAPAKTTLHLEWGASNSPRLFPLMRATLEVYPLTGTETQLELTGRYEPPLGPVGRAIDALVGHRIAEATVHRFLRDVAAHLRQALGGETNASQK